MLALAVVLGGCAAPQPTEIDYRCVLPNTLAFDFASDLATLFGNAIAEKAHLQILNTTRLKGSAANDVTYIVSLKSTNVEGLFVNVLFNRPYRTIAVTISGDIRNPEANLIAEDAVKSFSEVFPGSKLTLFSGNQALFGP